MGITFKYDAAGVTPPSNQSTRKFGQQMVLGEQQRKYQGQQQGYDRMFQLGRDVQQNAFQVDRDNRIADFQQQQAVDQGLRQANRDKTLFDQQQKQQRAKDFADARARIDTYAKEVVNDPSTPQEVRTKIQNLISGKMTALGGGFEAPAQQQFLDQYNSQLAAILSEIPPKAPPPTPEQALQSFLGDEQYARYGHLPWVPDGEGKFSVSKDALGQLQKEQEQQQKELEAGRPKSFQDYYNANEDKFDKDLDSTMQSMQDKLVPDDKGNVPPDVTREQALEQMQKNYDFRQKALGRPQYGDPTSAPTMPGAAPAAQGQMRSILETGQPAGIAPGSALARQRDALGMNATSPAAAQPAMGGQPPAAMTFDQKIEDYYKKVPEDQRQPYRDDAKKRGEQAFDAMVSAERGQSPAPMAMNRQQVKVDGKPLAVTPGTLTPQETAARDQIMTLPREQRIAALMPYDPELKGQTLEQLLESPESKAQYDALTKEGLTTGNYREDMLAQLDEMLQHNVLGGAGQMPPIAYEGMRADDITDPKAKAEVAKLPRPKNQNDRNTIRSGQLYVDPNGVIRARA